MRSSAATAKSVPATRIGHRPIRSLSLPNNKLPETAETRGRGRERKAWGGRVWRVGGGKLALRYAYLLWTVCVHAR